MNFSVIVCAYNEAHVIKKCLESISKIDFPIENFEIIVVNDGSNDDTGIIVKDFFSKNKKINSQYLSIKHAGLSIARNAGIYNSKFDYVVFIDADAIVDINILNEYQKTYRKSDIDFSGGRISLLNKNSLVARFFQKTRFKQIFEAGKYKEQLIGANMSFKKELFIKDGGFPDIFVSRGDDTFIRNRFMNLYSYYPTPNAIVYHERPSNIIDCLKIFYTESINGEKLKKMNGDNNIIKKIIINIMVLFFFITLINYPIAIFSLVFIYIIRSLKNSFYVVSHKNKKNVLFYTFSYSSLKLVERLIKIYVYNIKMFEKTPQYTRKLNNFELEFE